MIEFDEIIEDDGTVKIARAVFVSEFEVWVLKECSQSGCEYSVASTQVVLERFGGKVKEVFDVPYHTRMWELVGTNGVSAVAGTYDVLVIGLENIEEPFVLPAELTKWEGEWLQEK